METRASNGFSTLPVLSSQKTPSYYVLDVDERGWGKGDGILKPVLSKLCRSILISLLYFFSINELVSIIVDPHGDNITKILREPWAY